MDPVVPPGVTAELTGILSNLVLSDNKIRSDAENAINDRLARSPDLYLLALTGIALSADTDVMRSFSFVLLRRFLFRQSQLQVQSQSPNATSEARPLTLYDQISWDTISTIERLLLYSLSNEPSPTVRRASVDTAGTLASRSMEKGRHWHDLQKQVFNMIQSPNPVMRESAFRLFMHDSATLSMDMPTDDMLRVLKGGLEDGESIDVRFSALCASEAYISSSDTQRYTQALLPPMLETLPSVPPSQLPKFLTPLTVLIFSHPTLFQPHLLPLLTLFAPLILTNTDLSSTPMEEKPIQNSGKLHTGNDKDEENANAKKAALEFMVSLSHAKPGMVRDVDGWTKVIIRACLEGMTALADDDTDEWLNADPDEEPTDDPFSLICEKALNRLTFAMGSMTVLPPAFEHIPSLLASYNWQSRHAGLIAIAAIVEGSFHNRPFSEDWQFLNSVLGNVVNLVTSMFDDLHPRVRHAACYCVAQLCTDKMKITKNELGKQLLDVLVPTLQAPEPRVHSQASAALTNVCEGTGIDTLVPYLDSIVERLLKHLNPGNTTQTKRYVQEQAITTLAMVANKSSSTFVKYYSTIMPLLLDILHNANGADYMKLRGKAMECAGLIAIAVGCDIFRPDANTLVEILMQMQNRPVHPGDPMLNNQLIATWAKISQAMGVAFEPYLPVVMPPLLMAADVFANDDILANFQQQSSDPLDFYKQMMDMPTLAFDDTRQALETIPIYCLTFQARFAPYLAQSLQVTLLSLNFPLNQGVQAASHKLLPILLHCAKISNTLTVQMISSSFTVLNVGIRIEHELAQLISLYNCFSSSLEAIGGPTALPQEFHDGLIEATNHQLQSIASSRKERSKRPASEIADGFLMIGEIEGFVLRCMAKTLHDLDPKHPLLAEVLNVWKLSLNEDAHATGTSN